MSTVSIRVDGPDQAGEARRSAAAMAAGLGFDEASRGRAAIVVAECATNLWKHGEGGEILLSPCRRGSVSGIEILALDKGPGMSNPALCFQDGYSTAGSSGTGLGAVSRLGAECGVYTLPGRGAALLSRVWAKPPAEPNTPLEIGGLSVPFPGEVVCGDAYAVHQDRNFATVLVVDGLGHGQLAADSAMAATEGFTEVASLQPGEILDALHGQLRATRGAAAAVARFEFATREIRFAGIGNIAGTIANGNGSRQTVSQPGIIGHDVRNVREFAYAWAPGSVVLLYSDGISTHWSLTGYNGLLAYDPSLIAGVIYRDWKRGRDDATVVVIRERRAS